MGLLEDLEKEDRKPEGPHPTAKYRHRHIDSLTVEIISDTQRGYKVLQKDSKGKAIHRTGIIQYYSTAQIKDLFIKL